MASQLAAFIRQELEAILVDWQSFAVACLPAAETMTALELRNDAAGVLLAIAQDIEQAQTDLQQSEKSKGRAVRSVDAQHTSAEVHGRLRAKAGFDLFQMTAEYRALRASVVRRFIAHTPGGTVDQEEMIRFNEAIDQAVAESARFFQTEARRASDTFLGALAHELRTPLSVIVNSAHIIKRTDGAGAMEQEGERILRATYRMGVLLSDLADFTRVGLGVKLRLSTAPVRLNDLLEEEVGTWRITTGREVDLCVVGNLVEDWDAARLQQIFSNLIGNALRYGSQEAPVQVTARRNGDWVLVDVVNTGPSIPDEQLKTIFEPLQRGGRDEASPGAVGMGLGLFISRELARKHGGDLTVTSSGSVTTFTLSLPSTFQ